MFLFCVAVIILVSMFTAPAPAMQIQGLTFGSTTPEQRAATRASWNKWDVIHTCIILGITVLFYIYFW
jgi:SSS family solute:Na+ symporter